MLLHADIHVSHPDLVFSPTIEAVPDATVRADCRLDAECTTPLFYVITGASRGDVEPAVDADHTIAAADTVTARDGRQTVQARASADALTISSEAADVGVQFLEAESDETGWEVRVQAPDRCALRRFREFCRDRNVTFEMERLCRTEMAGPGRPPLSPEQRETLLAAYERGYFDVPRRTSQEELAGAFDVSGSAVSQRIRRAVATLISSTYPVDRR